MKSFSLILFLFISATAHANTNYNCIPNSETGGKFQSDAEGVIRYQIEFSKGLFSGNRVSFAFVNTAGNWSSDIFKNVKINADFVLKPAPSDRAFNQLDLKDQSFLLIGSEEDATIFGTNDRLYLSQSLLEKQNTGLALYVHSRAAIATSREYYKLDCVRTP